MNWVEHIELNSAVAYSFFIFDWLFSLCLVMNIGLFLFSPIQRFFVFRATKSWKKLPADMPLMHQAKSFVLGKKNNWDIQEGLSFQVLHIVAMLPVWSYFHFVRHYPELLYPPFVTKALWLYQIAIVTVPFVLGMTLLRMAHDLEDKAKQEFIQKRGLDAEC